METVVTLYAPASELVVWLSHLASSANLEPNFGALRSRFAGSTPICVEPEQKPVYFQQYGDSRFDLVASHPNTGNLLLSLTVEKIAHDVTRINGWCQEHLLPRATSLFDLLQSRFGDLVTAEPPGAAVNQGEPAERSLLYGLMITKECLNCPALLPQTNDSTAITVRPRLSRAEWIALVRMYIPNPFLHGVRFDQEDGGVFALAADTPPLTEEQWFAYALEEFPDPSLLANIRLITPAARRDDGSAAGAEMSESDWIAAAMQRFPDPRRFASHLQALLRYYPEAPVLRAKQKPGAPVAWYNCWLQYKMESLPDPTAYQDLYAEWESLARWDHGAALRDPRRSFNEAAEGCLARIREKGAGLNRRIGTYTRRGMNE